MADFSLPYFLVNGIETGSISVQDRGLAYGDGLFETCLFRNEKIPLWSYHEARLLESAVRLGILVDAQMIRSQLAIVYEKLMAAEVELAVIKITVTRGVGGRGYLPPKDPAPTLIVGVFPWPQYAPENQKSGVSVKLCQTRLSRNAALAGLKHLNRLEQILARSEWKQEFSEGICLDTEGAVIEGVFSNLFLISADNQLITPDLRYSGVNGVMRQRILDLCVEKNLAEPFIQMVTMSELINAKAVFLTNSVYGIWPVKRLVMPEKTIEWDDFSMAAKLQRALSEGQI